MRRVRIGLVVSMAVALAACDSPTSTEPFDVILASTLESHFVVPPVVNADATGAGSATVTMTVTRDSSANVIAAVADLDLLLNGFPPGTVIAGALLHHGLTGDTGPVVLDTGVVGGEVVLGAGAGRITRYGMLLDAPLARALLDAPTQFYLIVQTARTPTGAIRGQLGR
jgi:hypothetical protein